MPEVRQHQFPYLEPERHDGLSPGTPSVPQANAGEERRSNGTIALGARKIPALGGKATKGTTTLAHRIDTTALPEPAKKRARSLRRALCSRLAKDVGGGRCDEIGSLLCKFASVKTALADEALEGGDKEAYRRLTESARMDLLYAREHVAKAAKARQGAMSDDPLGELHDALLGASKEGQ